MQIAAHHQMARPQIMKDNDATREGELNLQYPLIRCRGRALSTKLLVSLQMSGVNRIQVGYTLETIGIIETEAISRSLVFHNQNHNREIRVCWYQNSLSESIHNHLYLRKINLQVSYNNSIVQFRPPIPRTPLSRKLSLKEAQHSYDFILNIISSEFILTSN